VGYEYDIFISYKQGAINQWLQKIFLDRFIFYLENELGREPLIFFDQDIQSGDTWPLKLQQALARSRCLVAFSQVSYFSSQWCMYEFGAMLERERKEKYRTLLNPKGLIQIVKVGDGVHFPPYAKQIQELDCRRHFYVSSAFEKTEGCLELEKLISEWVPDVAQMIREAPIWKADWINLPKTKIPPSQKPKFPPPTLE